MAKTGARKNAPNGLRGASSVSKSSQFAAAGAAAGAKPAKRKGGTTSSEARASKLNSEVRGARRKRVAMGNA